MRTLEAIEQLNQLVTRPGAATSAEWACARSLLSTLKPLQVLSICYSRRLSDLRPPVVAQLSSAFESRRDLLRWIYDTDSVFQQTKYLRLPSLEKRVLVSELVSYTRSRYRWMTSRIVHAYAFRPEFFRQRTTSSASRDWGPLYHRHEISKGSFGRRSLWIPNPPLKRVQRCLLELCLNHALRELPSCVNGCRRRHSDDPCFGIFRNAAAHLGQQYVAHFDIANFFPSISVEDIIPALLSLHSPMLAARSDSNKPEGEALYWRHDAAVFVARLTTHRGRLPQGAPTSPAIANLTFRAVEDRKSVV